MAYRRRFAPRPRRRAMSAFRGRRSIGRRRSFRGRGRGRVRPLRIGYRF